MAHPFRAAAEARDRDAMTATLAPDVQFHSPVAFRPFDGREATAGVLEAILSVFEDFGVHGRARFRATPSRFSSARA